MAKTTDQPSDKDPTTITVQVEHGIYLNGTKYTRDNETGLWWRNEDRTGPRYREDQITKVLRVEEGKLVGVNEGGAMTSVKETETTHAAE